MCPAFPYHFVEEQDDGGGLEPFIVTDGAEEFH